MKAENMMDAIGRLDEGLLAESLPAKRRNFRPLVAVAAVAAALAVTAMAVNLFGDEHWRLFYSTEAWGDQFAVQATYGGTVFPLEQLEKWKADIEQGVETVVHRNDGSVMDAVVHVAEYDVCAGIRQFLVRQRACAASIMPMSSLTGMKAPLRPPTWLDAITPPFLTMSLSMASAAVVPGAPVISRPISLST